MARFTCATCGKTTQHNFLTHGRPEGWTPVWRGVEDHGYTYEVKWACPEHEEKPKVKLPETGEVVEFSLFG